MYFLLQIFTLSTKIHAYMLKKRRSPPKRAAQVEALSGATLLFEYIAYMLLNNKVVALSVSNQHFITQS